jgi:ABC-type antimicrobial peptide transport system permease subunit
MAMVATTARTASAPANVAGSVAPFGLVVRHVSWLVGIGMSLGLAAALAAARAMRGLLFGIEPWDPLSQAATIAVLSLVAVAAAWIPTRRAMRVDPAIVLRTE